MYRIHHWSWNKNPFSRNYWVQSMAIFYEWHCGCEYECKLDVLWMVCRAGIKAVAGVFLWVPSQEICYGWCILVCAKPGDILWLVHSYEYQTRRLVHSHVCQAGRYAMAGVFLYVPSRKLCHGWCILVSTKPADMQWLVHSYVCQAGRYAMAGVFLYVPSREICHSWCILMSTKPGDMLWLVHSFEY